MTVVAGEADRSKEAASQRCSTTAPTSSSTCATWKATRDAARLLGMTDAAMAGPIEADAVEALAPAAIVAPTEADPAQDPAAAAVTTAPPAATPSAAARLTSRPLHGRR